MAVVLKLVERNFWGSWAVQPPIIAFRVGALGRGGQGRRCADRSADEGHRPSGAADEDASGNVLLRYADSA
jgi:hypothetical protein